MDSDFFKYLLLSLSADSSGITASHCISNQFVFVMNILYWPQKTFKISGEQIVKYN